MTVDHAAIGRSNRARGNRAELALARHLRTHGFPRAERAVRTGYRTATRTSADPGDITGTPGLIWSVKDTQEERLPAWLAELDAMVTGQPGNPLGFLVVRRRGHADPNRWWCWTALTDLVTLAGGHGGGLSPELGSTPVRSELGPILALLRDAEYGDEP